MADYITAAVLKGYMGISGASHDTEIAQAIAAATVEIDGWCGRYFDERTTQTRYLTPTDAWELNIPDTTTITTLTVDSTDDGTYDDTWTENTDFVSWPADGISRDGLTGWPTTKVIAVGTKTFPTGGRYPARVELVGTLGWAAIPEPVQQAAQILAAERFKLKEAPLGVVGATEFGGVIRVRDNQVVKTMLAPYRVASRALMVG